MMSRPITEKHKRAHAHALILENGSKTHKELAQKCGVSTNTISRLFYYEDGRHSDRRHVGVCENTLDKIIAGLSCALLAFFIPTPSEADNRMSLIERQQDCFAMIEIDNRAGTYNESEILQTELGDVIVKHTTVGGHRPGDDDYVEVMELPPGVFARPMRLDIPDGSKGRLCLFEFEGM